MNSLPTSIETAMQEAGFSTTEILVIRRLIEKDGLTLRELASKTGKSTGVLDQATRKLLTKGILSREGINNVPKFVLQPLSTISKWIEKDMLEKRDTLKRKFQNFESFIKTIEIDKQRPEMRFFEGKEGIVNAYRDLLGLGKEFLHYMPLQTTIEDDPLRDFMVEYFRERRRRGIFSRVIAHENSLGHRYQSRDPFEYRKTLLVKETEYPFTFEKIIAGDTIACFNHKEEKACFIQFSDLALSERTFFEQIWKMNTETVKIGQEEVGQTTNIPVATKTFSALRDFFLSPKSLVVFGAFALLAAGITFALYQRTATLNLARVRERVQSIAATAAFQFDANDLNELQVESDWKKPQWAKVVNQLKNVRESNHGLVYAYIVRKTPGEDGKMEFVSDSHSLNPYANVDRDATNDVNVGPDDGVFDPNGQELLQWPGQNYPSPPQEVFDAYNHPTSNSNFYTDTWGTMISGYAPIKDKNGLSVAVIAVDIDVNTFEEMNGSSFSFILYFLIAFILFVLIRLSAFNKSILHEIVAYCSMKGTAKLLLAFSILGLCATAGLYFYTVQLRIEEAGEKLAALAAVTAQQIHPDDLDALHSAKDMKKPEYQRVFQILNNVRGKSSDIKYAYILRPTGRGENDWEFVVDADSNWNLPNLWQDSNNDGNVDNSDMAVWPGFGYDISQSPESKHSIMSLKSNFEIANDQWGKLLSGFAPIIVDQKAIAVIGLDADYSNLSSQQFPEIIPFICFFLLIGFASGSLRKKI